MSPLSVKSGAGPSQFDYLPEPQVFMLQLKVMLGHFLLLGTSKRIILAN